MTKETFRIADNTVAVIIEPVRKERIRQDLRDLILDLDRKFESVLQLKGKYEADDGCRTTEEGVIVLDHCRSDRKRRPTVHATFSLPPRPPRHLFLYGQSHYDEILARRHHDRQVLLVQDDNDDGDDCVDNDDDDDASFCSLDSTKVRCGKKRSSQRRVRTDTREESSTSETCDILDLVQLSPVDTMINWSRGAGDELCFVVEDYHDDDARIKRRCSSFF